MLFHVFILTPIVCIIAIKSYKKMMNALPDEERKVIQKNNKFQLDIVFYLFKPAAVAFLLFGLPIILTNPIINLIQNITFNSNETLNTLIHFAIANEILTVIPIISIPLGLIYFILYNIRAIKAIRSLTDEPLPLIQAIIAIMSIAHSAIYLSYPLLEGAEALDEEEEQNIKEVLFKVAGSLLALTLPVAAIVTFCLFDINEFRYTATLKEHIIQIEEGNLSEIDVYIKSPPQNTQLNIGLHEEFDDLTSSLKYQTDIFENIYVLDAKTGHWLDETESDFRQKSLIPKQLADTFNDVIDLEDLYNRYDYYSFNEFVTWKTGVVFDRYLDDPYTEISEEEVSEVVAPYLNYRRGDRHMRDFLLEINGNGEDIPIYKMLYYKPLNIIYSLDEIE